jgi:hypothetical protein
MKKIILALLAVSTVSAFAGTLVNKKTGEELQMSVSSSLNLKCLSPNAFDFFPVSRYAFSEENRLCQSSGNGECSVHALVIIPTVLTAGAAPVVADLLSAPVRGSIKLVEFNTYKRDIKIFSSVSSGEDTYEVVSNKRFERIKDCLISK